ncbi:MAG: type II 3-dehydroquinate dehydratase [Chromatiales bacterium]|nr:type II 3-dehydroquinate dehydratase [Chromatiales bacterium]
MMTTNKILIINGPNLNLLGKREPDIYGAKTLAQIIADVRVKADELNAEIDDMQSNSESEIIERIHQAMDDGTECIIINPGAFTHTSIALRDAFLSISKPFIEIHLSNVFAREAFRQRSFLSDIAVAVIAGAGAHGYELALQAAIRHLRD